MPIETAHEDMIVRACVHIHASLLKNPLCLARRATRLLRQAPRNMLLGPYRQSF
jgi:hypothetical protein